MFNFLRYFIVIAVGLFFFLISQEQTKEEITTGYTETLIDFNILGDKNQLKDNSDEDLSKLLEKIHNDNWRVSLNSSADFVANRRLSYAKNIKINKNRLPNYVGDNLKDNVLGIRANFPLSKFDANVEIAPSTKFSFYAGNNGEAYANGKGVIQNVSTIKSIHVYVKGRNFPLDLHINLENSLGEIKSYYMGNLNFDNWQELTWKNPAYIPDFKQRHLKNKSKKPVYPIFQQDFLRLKSIKISRSGDAEFIVADSITYFAWIKVVYDKASIVDEEEEINDENNWGVYEDIYAKNSFSLFNSKYLEIEEIEKKLMNFKDSSTHGKANQQSSLDDNDDDDL